MIYYDSADLYVQSRTTVQAKIAAIDNIIEALETSALKAAASGDVTEYTLNDGQTQIKTVLRGADSVYNSIQAFLKLKHYYISKLNGRVHRLVDSKNIRNGHC